MTDHQDCAKRNIKHWQEMKETALKTTNPAILQHMLLGVLDDQIKRERKRATR